MTNISFFAQLGVDVCSTFTPPLGKDITGLGETNQQ
jgi:hypothetical protein